MSARPMMTSPAMLPKACETHGMLPKLHAMTVTKLLIDGLLREESILKTRTERPPLLRSKRES